IRDSFPQPQHSSEHPGTRTRPLGQTRGAPVANDKSTLQSILENVRDAGVAFGRRFAPPADRRPEVTKLLSELGIADPEAPVLNALTTAAQAWDDLGRSLSGVSLNFVDPAKTIAGLTKQAAVIQDAVDRMIRAPQDALAGLG